MKGGFNFSGLKRSQVSLVLIGFVCATVIFLAWTRTTFLSSLIQPRDNFLQVSSVRPVEEIKYSDGGDNSSQSGIVAHPSNNEREDNSPGTEDLVDSDKVSEEMNNTKLVDNKVPPVNSISTKTPGKDERSKNMTTSEERQGDKEISPEKVSEESSGSQDAEKGVTKPASSVSPPSPGKSEWKGNVTTPRENQVCNFAQGKWVEDPERPLYSGFGCQQWLSGMWSCRLTQRTDFEYEFLRWQPRDCQMESFSGPKFLKRMVNKTLAFVGDSLGRQQFQSLMCMVSEGKERNDVLDVGVEYGLVKAPGSKRPDGWAYRFSSTNTTILYYWSASLSDLVPIDPSDPQTDIAMHLDRPPAFLRHYIHKFDVLVLNTGHHWNRGKLNANRWVMHVGGKPNQDKKIANINGARNLTVHSIVSWVDSQLPKYPGLKAFYRSISPRHFFNGDWNTGGTCDNTTPLSGGKEVSKEESSDSLAAEATRGKGVKLLDITALSELRDEGHISRYSIKGTPGVQDCLHWCLPGVPDTWNEILFAQL